MGHVYYHHPGDKQFSLDFVHPDPDEIVSQIVEYDDDVAVKVSTYDLDREFYVVYTSRVGGGAVSDIEIDLSEALAEMDADNGTIVARLLEIYQALISQNEEEEGIPVEAYKNIDIDALPDVLDRTSWEGSATDVAGRLASNLILKHALPNANHRTAVALIQFYLRRLTPEFSMPETSVEIDPETYDWRDWVNEYINESKRLLTVRRKNVVFKHLREFGASTLERKHEVEIDLAAYELDMYPTEAKEVYAKEHEELWIEFVEEAVERTGYPELTETSGLSKAEFAEKIRNLE
ncbi:hypothetical protein [Halobacterium salinarum]|uniref:hypothetical protein n=1 Tax=Halobacterium salinarum TaxID=2242 RepID=UPI0025546A56|nr:hypothetical protein [Halobacterium salinarum]MDL0145125.1 hypothetical protein [Halobacterium salinarum]